MAAERAAAVGGAGAFAEALRGGKRVAVVAEAKRRSPSAGEIAGGLDPARYAASCVAGGARALSVLTEPSGFGGSLDDLGTVSAAVVVPVLRKDFLLEEAQLAESRAAGASAVLLIVRVLADRQLAHLVGAAGRYGLGTLVEAYDEPDLDRALSLPVAPTAIGINARDLSNFRVDLARVGGLVGRVPPEVAAVGLSGVATVADVESLAAAGADAVLVGTAVARAPDPEALVRTLAGVRRRGR